LFGWWRRKPWAKFLSALCGGTGVKQFCTIIGNRSMLQQTIDRVEVLVPPERVFAPCLSSASSSEFFFSNSEPMHLSSRLSVYPKWDGVNWGTKERILTSLQEIGKLDERLQRLKLSALENIQAS
jgi:hypothetical protein